MDSISIYLASGQGTANIINSPWSADSEVHWYLNGDIASENYESTKDNDSGTLTLELWPEKSDLELELECKNENDQSYQYQVNLFNVTTFLELMQEEWSEIEYPKDFSVLAIEQSSSQIVEVVSASDSNCIRVKGLSPGYEELKISFKNGTLGTVHANISMRVFEETTYKAKNDVPSFEGDCIMEVYKKEEQSPFHTLKLSNTGSITLGRASASAPGYADVDLKPFLSEEAQSACSRRQLKILMTGDNKLCVENIGRVPVQVNDKYELEPSLPDDQASRSGKSDPRSLVLLPPGSSITIADEIVILFKDETKGV